MKDLDLRPKTTEGYLFYFITIILSLMFIQAGFPILVEEIVFISTLDNFTFAGFFVADGVIIEILGIMIILGLIALFEIGIVTGKIGSKR